MYALNGNKRAFILAGKAFFTVQNELTQNRFTFKVVQGKDRETGNRIPIHFVSVFTGTNNNTHYSFMGTIFKDGTYKPSMKSMGNLRIPANADAVFAWIWKNLDALPGAIKFYHEGRCGCCGKRLTVPESILSGYGPQCGGRV